MPNSTALFAETLIAIELIKNEDKIFTHRRKLLSEAISIVEQWIQSHSKLIEWVKPHAGALCCVRLKPEKYSDTDIEKFYSLLPENELQLAAGNWVGEEKRIFRLGFGFLPFEKLKIGLQKLTEVLELTLNENFKE